MCEYCNSCGEPAGSTEDCMECQDWVAEHVPVPVPETEEIHPGQQLEFGFL